MNINATLETRTNKEGKTYECVILKISDKSEKIVFLSPAELELLKLNNAHKNNFDVMPDLR